LTVLGSRRRSIASVPWPACGSTTGATIEYFGPDGQIIETVTAATQRAIYLDWCQREGVTPDPQIPG
jgi:hypothetical protein